MEKSLECTVAIRTGDLHSLNRILEEILVLVQVGEGARLARRRDGKQIPIRIVRVRRDVS